MTSSKTIRYLATLMLAWLTLLPLALFTRPLPRSRHPKPRMTPAQLRELAITAGRKGRTARPMWPADRIANYRRQRPSGQFTAAQLRRWAKKRNALPGNPAGSEV